MNFFDTVLRRKILFASLYFSEGAPIGFIWLALPTQLRSREVPVDQITWLAAVVVLPWTFKFAWAPLVDLLRTRFWTLRHWIVAAQCAMGLSLAPLLWLDAKQHFTLLAGLLLLHAVSAATQDVAIDALCISTTPPGQRGQYNGWMQAGMLLGRASMGGGALVLAQYIGDRAVVGLLILATTFSMLLVVMSRPPDDPPSDVEGHWRGHYLRQSIVRALANRNTWFGLAFALIGGAAFKSLEVIYGPFLVDRGFDKPTIGWFSLGPMIGAMIVGSVWGGWLSDRYGPRRSVAASLVFIALAVATLALSDELAGSTGGWHLLACLTTTAVGIGVFTASSYALFMDITHPAIAATQFSAFMGATNGCESWSSYVSGKIISGRPVKLPESLQGYAPAMLAMTLASLVALPLLAVLRTREEDDMMDENRRRIGQ